MRQRVSLAIVLFVFVLGSAAVVAAELPPGFRLEPVVGGLTEPSALATTPDGRIVITERTTGNVRLLRLGELQATPACTVPVTATGEGGLLGVAVHPQFARTSWIYVYGTSSATGRNKVTRYVLGETTCGNPVDVLADLGAGPSFLRNGGGIAFGPDGKLYVATGDVEDSANGQGAGLRGKILRVNDDGSVPSDNPTPGSLVYAQGVRDGRGLDVNDAGTVYASDAGESNLVHDELNAVPAGGNLGWDAVDGITGGGVYDDPLAAWLPVTGVRGVGVYGASAFPDLAADGRDSDQDCHGADHCAGTARVDDNGRGECVGSNNNKLACTSNAGCPPRVQNVFGLNFYENAWCEMRDDEAEFCPGGVPSGDDSCGSGGTSGIDEADESFVNDLFLAGGSSNKVYRAVLTGAALDQLVEAKTFLDSTFLGDCPDAWVDAMEGRDGWLYLLARNSGGATGGLYRVVHDVIAGPREVSGPGSHFPLRVEKGATATDVIVSWEDLRSDAAQPRDDGNADPALRQPLQPAREYRVWKGTLGTWTSHAPVPGLDRIAGTAVNDALRKATITGVSESAYFLVSARSANLEGSLGRRSDGTERPGPAATDLCQTIGFHGSPSFDLWKCGQDFTLLDEKGNARSLSEFRGQPVMLDLSAIWCGPCQSEADVLENLHREFAARGVRFLTVLADEDDNLLDWSGRPTPAECRNWGDRAGTNPDHTFPCLGDPVPASQQQAWPKYNKWNAFPTNVILDQGLRVVYSEAGYLESTIRDKLNRLVGATDACLQ